MGRSRPSPHTVAQAPPPAGHDGSSRQSGEQPSPWSWFMSSHCSLPSVTMLPHDVGVHFVGPMQPLACLGVVQLQPSAFVTGMLSSVHVGLQPSPATTLPSSHCSRPATRPSPHLMARQALPIEHVQPHSTWHVCEQPSPARTLPSSHCSLPVTL